VVLTRVLTLHGRRYVTSYITTYILYLARKYVEAGCTEITIYVVTGKLVLCMVSYNTVGANSKPLTEISNRSDWTYVITSTSPVICKPV
jgi:hypothetical protein